VQGAYGHPVVAGHREVTRQWRQSGMHHHCAAKFERLDSA
jgi:hypothetical protein